MDEVIAEVAIRVQEAEFAHSIRTFHRVSILKRKAMNIFKSESFYSKSF